MKKLIFAIALIFLSVGLAFSAPTASQIIKKMDASQNAKNQIITYSMTIHGKRSSRTIEGRSWIVGDEKTFTLYLSPPREKGTKMLKVGDKLWTYYPKADRVVSISGHMLRKSVMGSDLSFEDMMEKGSIEDNYKAVLDGVEQVKGRKAYAITLTAKKADKAYQKMKIWVDVDRYVNLRQELFAASGKLLKTVETLDVMKTKKGWYIKQMLFKDALNDGKGTEFKVKEILFDQKISDRRFSKSQLRR